MVANQQLRAVAAGLPFLEAVDAGMVGVSTLLLPRCRRRRLLPHHRRCISLPPQPRRVLRSRVRRLEAGRCTSLIRPEGCGCRAVMSNRS